MTEISLIVTLNNQFTLPYLIVAQQSREVLAGKALLLLQISVGKTVH